jgi:hypothetical protein
VKNRRRFLAAAIMNRESRAGYGPGYGHGPCVDGRMMLPELRRALRMELGDHNGHTDAEPEGRRGMRLP